MDFKVRFSGDENEEDTDSVVTEDLVRYMHEAQYWANESFLMEDPSFAVDFAPNGKRTGT